MSGDERHIHGTIRPARRPPGWIAPGPAPRGPADDPDLQPGHEEDLCYLVGEWRIFQRTDGHRWSLDDLLTAALATDGPAPALALDLGCGIGSVLLMVAWAFPDARCVGIEAQPLSVDLARRSIRYDGCDERVSVISGDFRDPNLVPGTRFDLVTGTPPYFPAGTHTVSDAVQRGPCRHETRGGVVDYVRRAAALLAPDGRFVVCAAHRQAMEVNDALAEYGLVCWRRQTVVPREGKPPLIDIFEARHAGLTPTPHVEPSTIVVRDRDGAWPAEYRQIRARMGLPDRW